MKKEADDAKKAAAELTARLEALELEAKAKKGVTSMQGTEQMPFSLMPFLSLFLFAVRNVHCDISVLFGLAVQKDTL